MLDMPAVMQTAADKQHSFRFIDLFAIAALVFSATGLLIMKMHAASRPMTWPITALGVLIPALLAIWMAH